MPSTGVCALVAGKQIAVFRPTMEETVYAISNIDPYAQSSVMSRGIIGEKDGIWYVASPLKKQRFLLNNGICLDDENVRLSVFNSKIEDGDIFVNL